MKHTIKTIFLLLFLTTNWIYAQTDSDKDAAKLEKGQEIVNLARKAIDKGSGLDNLKSFYINIDESVPGADFRFEISLATPDKIRIDTILGGTKTIRVFKGGKYAEDSEMIINGEPMSMRSIGAPAYKPKIPQYIEETLPKERVEYLKKNPDELNKLFMEETFWSNVFPILLINPLNADIKYEYVGKAESAAQRADVVDVKSNFFRKIRLFFDENTHLLLMLTKELNSTKSVYTEKYYFSDYQLMNGLLIAKTVKRESELAFKDGSGKKNYGLKEVVIKEIKINSNLKAGLFSY